MDIPFVKAHGAHNDFLLTWKDHLPAGLVDEASAAVQLCARHTGVGADGWILLSHGNRSPGFGEAHAEIVLWNSDGSPSEISGNGTRCAAALLVAEGFAREEVRILTGAGTKHLQLMGRRGQAYLFEMNMGAARIEDLHSNVAEGHDAVILNVGNPQCAVFTPDFAFDWRALGAHLERHPRFPNRTNVSFVRRIDEHTLDVRFFERGAGETMSSGTGSTGAAAAALARGMVRAPVRVLTPAGPLEIREDNADLFLTGPAELVARGTAFCDII